MTFDYIFMSESVTEGHPDKLCDQISDALVGDYLRQDRWARIVAECAVSTGILFVSVKAASLATVDIPNTARHVILEVGYTQGEFNGRNCTVMTSMSQLPNEQIRIDEADLLADELDRLVAQENVTLFGYACTHTPMLMPLPIWLAHRVVRRMDQVRKEALTYLSPDGKCQVGVVFRNNRPQRIDSITLVASQTNGAPSPDHMREELLRHVIQPVFADEPMGLDRATRIQINPEGSILEGGPVAHAGLTGRKNGVDTYGGFSRQSGAALSGKDPTRIDRVGAYAARHAAKNVVAAGLADQCEVQLSYSIGVAAPVSIRVETFGTGHLPDAVLTDRVAAHFDFRPRAIIRRFHLRDLARAEHGRFYRRLAVYGHLGRPDLDLPWESIAEATALKSSVPTGQEEI